MKLILFLALTVSLVTAAIGQVPTPTRPANDDVVKISTNLIQLDVTVTDSKGRVVKDLKPEDFEVFENGEKQEITNFSFVSSIREIVPKSTDPADKTAIPVPPTAVRSDQVRRTIALVVDDLSLSFQSAYFVRRALRKFVDEQIQDGDLVAIIRTGAGIGALQQFTTDKRQLYAAIERVKWNPLGGGKIGAFAPINDSNELTNDDVSEEDQQAQENFENAFDDFRNSLFATGTLGALRYIVSGMGELPGRKSVILFSDGFRLLERDESGNSGTGRVMDFMSQLIETANRNSVVFYTIDGRGLQTAGLTAEDNVNATNERIQQVLSSRSAELFETQQGLSYLAAETGGFSVQNNNDLNRGIQRVLDDQSYYLIAYQPDSDTFDPKTRKFNKIEIRVRQKGLDVRYRSGFFNFVDRPVRPEFAVKPDPVEQIERALVSPFAVNDISLRLNALFGDSKPLGTFIRPLLHVNAGDLKFEPQPDGTKKAAFAVLAMLFGDNGMVIDQVSRTYTMIVKDDVFESIQKYGFVYHFSIPVKKPGAYQMRVAIRDSTNGKVGSASQFIEIPNLKKERLTLSGIVLENLSEAQWAKLFSASADKATGGTANVPRTDPMTDTSVRRFRKGSILRYGFEVYNARGGGSTKPDLMMQVRIINEGKVIMTGQKTPIDVTGQTDLDRIKASGALNLTNGLKPGDYILQIIVTDNLAKEKRKISTQFIQFEVAE